MVDRNERATATELVKDPWTQNRKLSTAHRKGTLDHLNAFNAKRKLRGAVYTRLERKTFSNLLGTKRLTETNNFIMRECYKALD